MENSKMGLGARSAKNLHKFIDNIPSLLGKYKCNNGFFGTKGRGRRFTRNIYSKDPIKEAKCFFELAGNGGVFKTLDNGRGIVSKLEDGTIISFRKISTSDGTPVVEINIRQSKSILQIKGQKIHFVEE